MFSTADVVIDRPERYGKQLASRLGHKLAVADLENGWTLAIGDGTGRVIPMKNTLRLEAQASSRAFLGHMAPEGGEGELFGLYATTGRAISFISPMLFALFITLGGSPYWGILGIVVVVLFAGLLLMLPLRAKFVR